MPSAPKPSDAFSYRPELDALRFFAFLCVFVSHLSFHPTDHIVLWRTGGFGLPLFFLLSAYLIVSLLQREVAVTQTVDVGAFMMRRGLRIWPLYFAAILINQIAGLFWRPGMLSWQTVLSMLFFSTNIYMLQTGVHLQMLSALWSISVEEQFYLVVPWIGRFFRKQVMAAFFVAVLLLSYVDLFYLGHVHAGTVERVWPNSFVHFQFFSAGALLALYGFRLRPVLWLRITSFLAGLALWVMAQKHFLIHLECNASSGMSLCTGYACVLAGTTAIFLAFLGAPVRFPKWILYFGTISYGLYVFHQFWLYLFSFGLPLLPGSTWGTAALALLGTCASAALSYRYLEKPVLRFKKKFEAIRTRV